MLVGSCSTFCALFWYALKELLWDFVGSQFCTFLWWSKFFMAISRNLNVEIRSQNFKKSCKKEKKNVNTKSGYSQRGGFFFWNSICLKYPLKFTTSRWRRHYWKNCCSRIRRYVEWKYRNWDRFWTQNSKT